MNDVEFIAETKARLAQHVQNAGLRKQVALEMGVSPSRLSNMLDSEKNITLKTLFRISRAINLHPLIDFEIVDTTRND